MLSKDDQKALVVGGVAIIFDLESHVSNGDRGVQALIVKEYPNLSGKVGTVGLLHELIDRGLIQAETIVAISLTSHGRLALVESAENES